MVRGFAPPAERGRLRPCSTSRSQPGRSPGVAVRDSPSWPHAGARLDRSGIQAGASGSAPLAGISLAACGARCGGGSIPQYAGTASPHVTEPRYARARCPNAKGTARVRQRRRVRPPVLVGLGGHEVLSGSELCEGAGRVSTHRYSFCCRAAQRTRTPKKPNAFSRHRLKRNASSSMPTIGP